MATSHEGVPEGGSAAPPVVSDAIARQIAVRHGLGTRPCVRLPSIGVFNAVYGLGDDLILRVPRAQPRAAGVRTPRLVAFDDSLALLPVPYAVYERVRGEPLERLGLDPAATPSAYRALGRDLARLHTGVAPGGPVGDLGVPNLPQGDPRPLPEELAAAGYCSVGEARWLGRWLERLPPLLQAPEARRFLHGDTQATNVLVQPESREYRALIDWGGCGWGDPALDFSGMPLAAVPATLAGYRELATLPEDATAEARILRYHLHFALLSVRQAPQPRRSWAERPLGYLLAVMRFLLDPPDPRWVALHP